MGFEALPTLWPRRLGDGRFKKPGRQALGRLECEKSRYRPQRGRERFRRVRELFLIAAGTGGGESERYTHARARGERDKRELRRLYIALDVPE